MERRLTCLKHDGVSVQPVSRREDAGKTVMWLDRIVRRVQTRIAADEHRGTCDRHE